MNHIPSTMTPEAPEPSSLSDAELVTRMVAGSRAAFGALFSRHQGTVFRFCLHMTGAIDVAEDLTQEVFMALARSGHRYVSDTSALSSYLYGVARNLVRRHERRRRVRHEVDLAAIDERNAPAVLTDPDDGLVRREELAALRSAILRLPSRYREVIVLCELHGRSYDEAAGIVGCPVGTIRSRLSRARRLLMEKCRASLAGSARPGSTTWFLNGRPGTVSAKPDRSIRRTACVKTTG